MNVLITGVNGFLGHYIVEALLDRGHNVVATGKGASRLILQHALLTYAPMDFTDAASVQTIFQLHQPTHVLHAGAISKPDACEENRPLAKLVNVGGTQIMLNAAQQYSIPFLFMSTDFVFDGIKGMYKETDAISAVNFYGETKISAEQLVQQYPFTWSIVRTVLVYGKPINKRNNILTIVRDKLEKGEPYQVFNDQVRTPTYAEDLAHAMVTILEKNAAGVFHICGEDVLTPYDMAIATGKYLGLDVSHIQKITAADWQQPAKRPPITGLNIEKAKRELGYQPTSFAEGLKKTLE